jgi:SAM-dependent methyltransferase
VDAARTGEIIATDLKGKTVLDIGGYSGEMAKLAMDNGAARAIVLDNHQFEHYGWEDKKHEGVEYVQGDFMEWKLTPRETEAVNDITDRKTVLLRPDVIVFYNILYHLKNPWAALDHLRTLIKPDGEMLLCTLFRYHEGAWMYLYEPRECNPTDETVFWGPSLEAIERLLTATGWLWERKAAALDRCVYRCKLNPDFKPILKEEGWAKA